MGQQHRKAWADASVSPEAGKAHSPCVRTGRFSIFTSRIGPSLPVLLPHGRGGRFVCEAVFVSTENSTSPTLDAGYTTVPSFHSQTANQIFVVVGEARKGKVIRHFLQVNDLARAMSKDIRPDSCRVSGVLRRYLTSIRMP